MQNNGLIWHRDEPTITDTHDDVTFNENDNMITQKKLFNVKNWVSFNTELRVVLSLSFTFP